jgi:signal transduction histidine kinase
MPVTIGETPEEQSQWISKMLHALSQPITALECGLELSLRKDRTPAELRARLRASLGTARILHQRLLEFQVLQDAGEPGNTSHPAAIQTILVQLREDYSLIARSAEVKLAVKSEPAMVYGDEARLRSGFFHLLEFLMRICPPHGNLRVCSQSPGSAVLEVNFRSDASNSTTAQGRSLASDLDLRIAQRTFRAAGGNLALTRTMGAQITGYVHLLLATDSSKNSPA